MFGCFHEGCKASLIHLSLGLFVVLKDVLWGHLGAGLLSKGVPIYFFPPPSQSIVFN